MRSVIEKSLEEYQKYIEGKEADVTVVKVTIPVKTEFNADTIKDLRKQINITQKGLAGLVGVSPRTVESWESNRSEPSRSAQKLLTLLLRDKTMVSKLKMI